VFWFFFEINRALKILISLFLNETSRMDAKLWKQEFVNFAVSGEDNDDGSATLVFSSNAAATKTTRI
jgi:hypothetical protein